VERLARGESHADVARVLEDAGRLTGLAAVALFDDRARHADVLPRLGRELGGEAATVFRLCNQGAHGRPLGDLVRFVRTVERLARFLAALR
jgi:hypothetical protein